MIVPKRLAFNYRMFDVIIGCFLVSAALGAALVVKLTRDESNLCP